LKRISSASSKRKAATAPGVKTPESSGSRSRRVTVRLKSSLTVGMAMFLKGRMRRKCRTRSSIPHCLPAITAHAPASGAGKNSGAA